VGCGGWGVGDRGLGPTPQTPIPNPQSPIISRINIKNFQFNKNKIFN